MGFLRYDSEAMQFVGRLADYAWLSILCFICSIPIFTAGAAVSAKYYVSMKLERGEAPGVTVAFFHSFKQNFKQGTLVTLILVVIAVFFAADWLIVYRTQTGVLNPIIIGMLAMFSAMVALATFCVFPMIARFEMTLKNALWNSLMFAVVHLPRVVLGVFLAVIPYIISIWYFKWGWLIWLFVQCMALYYNTIFFVKKFDILEERTFGEKTPDKTQIIEDDEEFHLNLGDEDSEGTEDSRADLSEDYSENEEKSEPDSEVSGDEDNAHLDENEDDQTEDGESE